MLFATLFICPPLPTDPPPVQPHPPPSSCQTQQQELASSRIAAAAPSNLAGTSFENLLASKVDGTEEDLPPAFRLCDFDPSGKHIECVPSENISNLKCPPLASRSRDLDYPQRRYLHNEILPCERSSSLSVISFKDVSVPARELTQIECRQAEPVMDNCEIVDMELDMESCKEVKMSKDIEKEDLPEVQHLLQAHYPIPPLPTELPCMQHFPPPSPSRSEEDVLARSKISSVNSNPIPTSFCEDADLTHDLNGKDEDPICGYENSALPNIVCEVLNENMKCVLISPVTVAEEHSRKVPEAILHIAKRNDMESIHTLATEEDYAKRNHSSAFG